MTRIKMKYILQVVLLISLLSSCNDPKPVKIEAPIKEKTEAERLQDRVSNIKRYLDYEKEKINLLAEFHNLNFDTVNNIIKEYLVITLTVRSSDKNAKQIYQSAIAKISLSNKISKSKIASLLFSYKYEMITKKDIAENAVSDFKDNYVPEVQEEEPEEQDP